MAGSHGTAPDVLVSGAASGHKLGLDGALLLGDLNGDGLQDLILGADGGDGPANARAACGEVEVVFGQATWANPFLDLSQSLNGSFLSFAGGAADDELSKNNALAVGDLDGDGIVDLLAGAPGVDGPAGSPVPTRGRSTACVASPARWPAAAVCSPSGSRSNHRPRRKPPRPRR